jgi:hypothetical protein
VYLANGQAGTGTLVVSWPAFTTANGQAVAADRMTLTIAPDGFVSVNLAPNLGATPAGLYYTAVFYLSDGTVNTEYRRFNAAELLGVFNGIVHQPAAGIVSGNYLERARTNGVRRMRMMNEFEAQVLSDLSVLKTQMTGLMGDGNGGRMADLERRMERHEQNWQRTKGFLAAVSVLFAVVEVAFEAWHRH